MPSGGSGNPSTASIRTRGRLQSRRAMETCGAMRMTETLSFSLHVRGFILLSQTAGCLFFILLSYITSWVGSSVLLGLHEGEGMPQVRIPHVGCFSLLSLSLSLSGLTSMYLYLWDRNLGMHVKIRRYSTWAHTHISGCLGALKGTDLYRNHPGQLLQGLPFQSLSYDVGESHRTAYTALRRLVSRGGLVVWAFVLPTM